MSGKKAILWITGATVVFVSGWFAVMRLSPAPAPEVKQAIQKIQSHLAVKPQDGNWSARPYRDGIFVMYNDAKWYVHPAVSLCLNPQAKELTPTLSFPKSLPPSKLPS